MATATAATYTYGHTLSLHDALPIVAGAEKLNAALVALAALADRDDGVCAHQAQQRAFYALVALVRALERGFGDAVNDRLADPLPGVGNQQIVDSAIGEGEGGQRSEEHTSELPSLMRISYAVFCLNKQLLLSHPYQLV